MRKKFLFILLFLTFVLTGCSLNKYKWEFPCTYSYDQIVEINVVYITSISDNNFKCNTRKKLIGFFTSSEKIEEIASTLYEEIEKLDVGRCYGAPIKASGYAFVIKYLNNEMDIINLFNGVRYKRNEAYEVDAIYHYGQYFDTDEFNNLINKYLESQ